MQYDPLSHSWGWKEAIMPKNCRLQDRVVFALHVLDKLTESLSRIGNIFELSVNLTSAWKSIAKRDLKSTGIFLPALTHGPNLTID